MCTLAAFPDAGLAMASPPATTSAAAGPTAMPAPARATALRLSLDQAIERALRSGQEMRSAQTGVREADARVQEALSGALPQLSGTLGYTRQIRSIYSDVFKDSTGGSLLKGSPFAAGNSWNAELQASQLLFSGGKVGAGLAAARAYRRAAREQARETAGEVRFQVRRAYLDAVLSSRLVEIAESTLALAREQLRQVELHHRQGTKAEYDVLRAQVDAANQEPPVVAARNAGDVAVLELKRLINVPADQPLDLITALDFEDGLVPVPEDSLDLSSRPTLLMAAETVEMRHHAVHVAQSDRLPSLSAQATLSNFAYPNDFFPGFSEFGRNWSAGFKLSLPIFTGFRAEAAVDQAQAEEERAELDLEQARETARLEVTRAKAEVERTAALLAARRQTVRWARRSHELAGVRFRNGLSTQLEVSDARLQLQTAQVQEVQVTRDYRVALAALERALGRDLRVVMRPMDSLEAPRQKN